MTRPRKPSRPTAPDAVVRGARWGHININVSNLERSVAFYRKLGFEPYLPGIPYLGLEDSAAARELPEPAARALGLERGTSGRACIMQLGADGGYPKIDLTEFARAPRAAAAGRAPPESADLGPVRLCLIVPDVAAAWASLEAQGVAFVSPPACGDRGLATLATCRDPDGTLIELLEIHRDRWVAAGIRAQGKPSA